MTVSPTAKPEAEGGGAHSARVPLWQTAVVQHVGRKAKPGLVNSAGSPLTWSSDFMHLPYCLKRDPLTARQCTYNRQCTTCRVFRPQPGDITHEEVRARPRWRLCPRSHFNTAVLWSGTQTWDTNEWVATAVGFPNWSLGPHLMPHRSGVSVCRSWSSLSAPSRPTPSWKPTRPRSWPP